MFSRLITISIAMLLAITVTSVRADDKKSDKETKVPAGTEFSLTPVSIAVGEKPDDEGRYEAKVKLGEEATKVKMPTEKWILGFTGSPAKGGGVAVEETLEAGALAVEETIEAGVQAVEQTIERA